MSIAFKRGSRIRNYGKTSVRDSLKRRRNRCCGDIDELISQMGFARSICPDVEVRTRLKALQLDLYRIAAVIAATSAANNKWTATISVAVMDALETEIRRVKSVPGLLRDGSLFWELPAAAALDVARSVSRRAERSAQRLINEGALPIIFIPVYLNRLADVLWLLGRLLESRRSIDS